MGFIHLQSSPGDLPGPSAQATGEVRLREARSQGGRSPCPDPAAAVTETPPRSGGLDYPPKWDRRAEKRRHSPSPAGQAGGSRGLSRAAAGTPEGAGLNEAQPPFKSRGGAREPIAALALRPGSRAGERRGRPQPGELRSGRPPPCLRCVRSSGGVWSPPAHAASPGTLPWDLARWEWVVSGEAWGPTWGTGLCRVPASPGGPQSVHTGL